VGSAGWEHADWQGGFYPDDLPEEWRLAYYNTAYSCVWLGYADWSGCDPATLAAWVDDTHERFRFVLEMNPAGPTEGDRDRLDALAPRLAAPDGRVIWLEDVPDLKVLARQLQELAGAPQPVYLLSRGHDLALMERARTLLEVLGL
jgi:hypothetical protein